MSLVVRLRCVVSVDSNTNAGAFGRLPNLAAAATHDVGFVDELAFEGIVHRSDE